MNDREALRQRELAMLAELRTVVGEIGLDGKATEAQRRHGRRLIQRIDGLRRRWGASDATE